MRPSCANRDERLLRLVHGDLPGLEAFRLRAHLAGCPECRARRRSLSAVTRSLALAYANPRLGSRTFAPPMRSTGSRWVSAGLLVALIAVVFLVVSREVAVANPVAAPAPRGDAGARPVLASAPTVVASAPTRCLEKHSAMPNLPPSAHDR